MFGIFKFVFLVAVLLPTFSFADALPPSDSDLENVPTFTEYWAANSGKIIEENQQERERTAPKQLNDLILFIESCNQQGGTTIPGVPETYEHRCVNNESQPSNQNAVQEDNTEKVDVITPSYFEDFITARGLTLGVELLVIFLLGVFVFGYKDYEKLLVAGLVASTLTLPYLRFVFPSLFDTYIAYLVVGEIIVTLVEVLLYYYILPVSIKRALLMSLLANSLSLTLGLLVF